MVYQISAPALHAARTILQNFDLHEKSTIRATERNLAILIDVCTQVFRVQAAVDTMVRTIPWADKNELGRRLEQLRESVRAVEVVRNRMPTFGTSLRVPQKERDDIEIKLTKDQMREAQQFGKQVAAARTVTEQQSLLMKAGLVRHQTS